jgi:hypothetical protein
MEVGDRVDRVIGLAVDYVSYLQVVTKRPVLCGEKVTDDLELVPKY